MTPKLDTQLHVLSMDSIFKSVPEQLCAIFTEIYAKCASVQNRYSVAKNSLKATETKGVAPRHGLEPRT